MAKAVMNKIEPVHVSDDCWLYGERDDLVVVKEIRDAKGALEQTVVITIPWADVSRARGPRPLR